MLVLGDRKEVSEAHWFYNLPSDSMHEKCYPKALKSDFTSGHYNIPLSNLPAVQFLKEQFEIDCFGHSYYFTAPHNYHDWLRTSKSNLENAKGYAV